jgi:hypothetical protein
MEDTFDPTVFLERLRSGELAGKAGDEEFRSLTEEQLETIVQLMASKLES